MDLIFCFSVAKLEMMVTQSSSVALFNPFHCTEVTQDQSHSAISGCIEEASVSDLQIKELHTTFKGRTRERDKKCQIILNKSISRKWFSA